MASNQLKIKTDNVRREIAQQQFAMILSRQWFKEFKSIEENTLDIDADGKPLKATFVYGEKVVNI